MQHDLYSALGVARTESASGIRTAFRDLARRYHPDRVGPGGAAAYREIEEAHDVLANPSTRRRYDATALHDAAAPARAPSRRPGLEGLEISSVSITLRGARSVRPSMEALVERLVRNFTATEAPKGERIERLELEVHLGRERARRGALLRIGLPICRRCPACSGFGHTALVACALCLGGGMVEGTRHVGLRIPAGIPDGAELLVPLDGFGIHNFYACVRVNVEGDAR